MTASADLEAFVRGLPKAELHLHIEGTLEPKLMLELAKRNGVEFPFRSVAEVEAAYDFIDLQSFLDIYYDGAAVLLHEQDFYDLTLAYLDRVATQGVRHVEIFFDPQTHTGRGVPFEAMVTGIHRALLEGEKSHSITSRLILAFLRHLSSDAALATLNEALPFRDWIDAVGLDSSELGNPPGKFVDAFLMAKSEGLGAVAHAGEEGPPEFVWGALDLLGVSRIDHGVRSDEDDALIERLIREQIPLTMCPLSNVKLRVFDRLEDHNLKRLLDRGVRVTINSDDPGYFGGYLLDNFLATAEALRLSRQDLVQLARNSIEGSFLDDVSKATLLEELDTYVRSS